MSEFKAKPIIRRTGTLFGKKGESSKISTEVSRLLFNDLCRSRYECDITSVQ